MYVEQLKNGRWAVCEDDGTIVATHKNKSAATRHQQEIAAGARFDSQAESDEMFLQIHQE